MKENSKRKLKVEEKLEQSLVLVGCLNEELINKITKLVEEENGGKVVVTNSACVYDYLESEGKITTRSNLDESAKLRDFLYNPVNQKHALEQALSLWNILTKNAPIEEAQKRVLSKTLILKTTTLKDYKEINELLDFLKVFGYIEYSKQNATYEFKMIFGKEVRRASAQADIVEGCANLNASIEKYKSVLKSDFNFTEDKLADECIQIKKDIDTLIKI